MSDPHIEVEWEWYQQVQPNLGRASWLWDDEFEMHIPCCSRERDGRLCGNGPLVGPAILSGDCGEHGRR